MGTQIVDIPDMTSGNLSHSDLLAAVTELVARMWGCVDECASVALGELQESAARVLNSAIETDQRLAELSQRVHGLEEMALTDALTGVANRRGFQAELARCLAHARRHGERGVLISIDLDGFKDINDTHGHLAGDQVLFHVAKLLSENIRSTDTVARMGGDEFMVLLTRTSSEDGVARAESLERYLNESSIDWGSRSIPIRASFGVRTYSGTDTPERLIGDVDEAMYKSKRNRVERRRQSAQAAA